MIGNALRAEIDRYASEMRRSSPIFCKVEDGTLTRAQAQAFLESLRFLGRQTPALLLRARGRATATGDDALAAFYSQALREAEDHESWPTWDIDPVSTGLLETSRGAVPSIGRLLTYLEGMIDADPILYLVYVLFAEYVTVFVSPEWLRRVAACEPSPSVVGESFDLDRERVEDILDTIDARVDDPLKLPAMRQALLETTRYFEAFSAEVTEERLHDVRPSRQIAPHVSAA